MSASEVGFLAQGLVTLGDGLDDEAFVEFDLTELSEESRVTLQSCVAEYRSAGRRVVSELLTMTEQLVKIQEILPARKFYPFVRQELGLSKRTITRYLHLNKVLQQHFAVEGRVPVNVANAFSSRALEMLSPDTDEAVIQEVRAVIEDGGKIDSRAVESILAKREADHAAQLAAAQADAQAAARALERSRDLHAVELARAQRELTAQTELLRRAEANSVVLEEENTALRKQSTEVRFEEKKVEVVPPGFASIQEAIDTKQGDLNVLVAREESAVASIAALEEQRREAAEKLAQFNANVDDFLVLKSQVEQIISKFPLSTLKEMAVGDKDMNAALGSLGQTLKLFGEQLNSAAV